MFGSKLRAWMEAVRPKKKQHRKEKQGKGAPTPNDASNSNKGCVTSKTKDLPNVAEKKHTSKEPAPISKYEAKKTNGTTSQMSRYSANNLSSPESAYSTGYSTDGTSPGGVPPEYPVTYCTKDNKPKEALACNLPLQDEAKATKKQTAHFFEDRETAIASIYFGKISEPSALLSPRQRNRIRTNPWLQGGAISAAASPLPSRPEAKITPLSFKKVKNSHFPRSLSDEDDCNTLNEMMGKYDESYVYEKETDILSDSDPTDCDSDIDTGQDGGDEEDNGEEELNYIDDGSFTEIDSKIHNTGHCMYIIPSEMQRMRSSRRRATRRSKEASGRSRRRSSSNKKKLTHAEKPRHSSFHQNGSKSAGATPIAVRRSGGTQLKSDVTGSPKRRSNSVCFQRNISILIDKRDREADMKYKELISQAEQIIRTMNVNGLSPRRLAGPANKRVEVLRSTECAKPEVIAKKPSEEVVGINAPSTINFKTNRFSPKKNHITNFIINNSPVLVQKELQAHSPVVVRRPEPSSLLSRRKSTQYSDNSLKTGQFLGEAFVPHRRPLTPSCVNPRWDTKPKSILHKSEAVPSPRHFRNVGLSIESSSSSEEDDFVKHHKLLSKSCPQSEPLKRKVYFGRSSIHLKSKAVAFNLAKDMPNFEVLGPHIGSSENLRQQVLLNTIQSLKKNLESHSASLQQTYRTNQSMYKY